MADNVLVTGAHGALGQYVVKRFVQGGARVFATALPDDKSVPADTDQVRWVRVDVTRTDSVKSALAGLKAAGTFIDGLVHCAGGFRFSMTDKNRDEDIDFLLDVNLRSAFILLRELLPEMKAKNHGRIVLVSARATLAPPAGMGAYAASKAGLNALVASAAEEVKSHDININAVLPTMIDTPANRRDMPGADPSKWVSPESLAEIIHSLAQPWGKPIHGALLPVAGRL